MSIPVLQIFSESFKNFNEHKLSWLRLAFAPFVLYFIGLMFMILVSFITGQAIEPHKVPPSFLILFANVIYMIFAIIAGMSLYINGYRYGILNEGGDTWWQLQMNMRVVKLILYSLLIGLIVVGFVLLGAGIIVATQLLVHNVFLDVTIGILIGLYGFYALIRLSLIFPLISIDREKPLKTSWRMLKGNVLRLIGLMILITFVIGMIGLFGFLALLLIGIIFSLLSPVVSIVVLTLLGLPFIIFMWLLNWAVFAKAISLVYLSFSEGKV